jgi:hypothetical protein
MNHRSSSGQLYPSATLMFGPVIVEMAALAPGREIAFGVFGLVVIAVDRRENGP